VRFGGDISRPPGPVAADRGRRGVGARLVGPVWVVVVLGRRTGVAGFVGSDVALRAGWSGICRDGGLGAGWSVRR